MTHDHEWSTGVIARGAVKAGADAGVALVPALGPGNVAVEDVTGVAPHRKSLPYRLVGETFRLASVDLAPVALGARRPAAQRRTDDRSGLSRPREKARVDGVDPIELVGAGQSVA